MQKVELEESTERRCTLYSETGYEDEHRSSYAFSLLSEAERRKQREQDKEDFLEWFWLSPLAGGLAGDVGVEELDALGEFAIENGLTRGHSRDTHEQLEEAVKEAVEDDLVIPVIDRADDWGGGYVPADASQMSTLPDGPRVPGDLFPPLSGAFGSGEAIVPGPYQPSKQEALLKAARSAGSGAVGGGDGGGFDWLGAAEAAAGALLGGTASDNDSGGDPMLRSFSDGVGSSLLGDAQPFDYQPDIPDGDVDELSGMPFNGEPGAWISSMPGTMPQLRQYGPIGTPLTDFDLEAHHGNPNPHAHNWDGYSRDDGAPVSLLPW
ncbi:hypothetical protein AWB74_04941 [Caballeronia arvi]|uniref:Uncharacterized protein n=1 Tax=Caballeronia arvi TaxID=1777135 RepID=A0A158K572_9BURK|nr:hypothetical protein [Caballeronia arvi]SAL76115.1 hypothetical protein AWB74_04941 [Caballeronia arvi]